MGVETEYVGLSIKRLLQIDLLYWFNKKIGIYLIYKTLKKKKKLILSVWKYHKNKEIKGYEDEWLSNWWKHFTVWKNH